MLATCTPLGRGVGARAAGLYEGTRLASPRSPLLLGRRQGARRCQGRVLAFQEGEQQKEEEGPVKQGAGAGAAEAGPACASVTFKTCRHVGFGQVLKVVGGLPQLGDWNCKQAPAMTWSEGDMWLLSLDLPAGEHQFKVVVDKGSAGAEWEAGANRTLQVPAPEASAHGAFTVECEWGNTVANLETLPEGELKRGGALSVSEDDVPLLRPEDLTAEPYSPAGDEGETPTGVVGKMTLEGGPASKKPQQMGQGSDAALRGEPAGGLKPSTEASVKKDLQKRALSRDADDDDEGGDSDDYGSGGKGATGGTAGKQAGAAQQGQRDEPPPPPPTSAFTLPALPTASDPPPGLQLAASAAGLLALPVVAWSEWVLKSTGCGLPPGPSGLLGAAEGVSYLVVGTLVLWSLTRKLGTGQGLPAGPAGALGAVEGGSWLAVLSGLAVLGLQWQTYGYIPSALPDSNCFGAEAPAPGYTLAQAAKSGTGAPAAAPALTNAGSQVTPVLRVGSLRLPAGGPSLPQGNLLFSAAEGVLSQSGSIIQTAETAAAAMAAAAAGQPPPAAVAAAVQHLQHKAMQAQQVASMISARIRKGADEPMHAAAAQAAQAVQQAAVAGAQAALAPQLEPLAFQPPRVAVRAALKTSWAALQHNEKLQKLLEPYPLPAVARQAAAAQAAGAVVVVEHVAEVSVEVVGHDEPRARAFVRHAIHSGARELMGVGDRLLAALPPQLRAWLPASAAQQQQQAAPAAATAVDLPSKAALAAGPAASTSPSKAARVPQAAASVAQGGKAAAEVAGDSSTKPATKSTAISGAMFAGAVADLKEGYVGLWHSALEFDPHTAVASLQERVQAGQQQAAAAAAKAAAANALAGQPPGLAASSAQPAAVAASGGKAGVAAAASSSSSKAGAAAASKPSTVASGSKAVVAPAAASTSIAVPKKAEKPAAAGVAAAAASTPAAAAGTGAKAAVTPALPSTTTAVPKKAEKPAAAGVAAAPASAPAAAAVAVPAPGAKAAVIPGAASTTATVPKKTEKPAAAGVAAASGTTVPAPIAAAAASQPSTVGTSSKASATPAAIGTSAAVPKKAEKPAAAGVAAAAAGSGAMAPAAPSVPPSGAAASAPGTPPGAAPSPRQLE